MIGKTQAKILSALARSQAKSGVEWSPLMGRLGIKHGHWTQSSKLSKAGYITHGLIPNKAGRQVGFAKITAKGRTALKEMKAVEKKQAPAKEKVAPKEKPKKAAPKKAAPKKAPAKKGTPKKTGGKATDKKKKGK